MVGGILQKKFWVNRFRYEEFKWSLKIPGLRYLSELVWTKITKKTRYQHTRPVRKEKSRERSLRITVLDDQEKTKNTIEDT